MVTPKTVNILKGVYATFRLDFSYRQTKMLMTKNPVDDGQIIAVLWTLIYRTFMLVNNK